MAQILKNIQDAVFQHRNPLYCRLQIVIKVAEYGEHSMKDLKQTLLITLILGFASNAWALKISELFVSGSIKSFKEAGFQNPGAAKGKLELMFQDVFPSGKVTAERLESIVSDLAKEDAFFKELEKTLKLDSKSVDFKDIEQAYIHSVMISHMKGKNLVCNDACAPANAATSDKVSVLKISDQNLMEIKNKLASMSSSQIKKIVSRGLGGSIPANLGPLDQKQLAFFFLMKKSKSKVQRDFAAITEKISLVNGRPDLLGSGSSLYKVPSTVDNLTDDQLIVYTGVLEMAAKKRSKDPQVSIKSAFYASLDDIINNKELSSADRLSLKETKDEMLEKNCLFK